MNPNPSIVWVLLTMATIFAPAQLHAANIVCLTSEDPDNYQAVDFLRDLTTGELQPLGHRVTIVVGNRAKPTFFEGLEAALADADLLVIFVRRATPPLAQMRLIQSHLEAGKPVIGIRTANHAFARLPSDPLPTGCAEWPEFVPEVLGCQNTGYETRGLPYAVALHPQADPTSEILQGVDCATIVGHTSLYRVLPLAADVRPLLVGTAEGVEPAQPIAWSRQHGPRQSRIFYTSLGDPADVRQPPVRQLIVNAIQWALAERG